MADKVKDGKDKKVKEPGKVSRWFKDFFSELKKVTWPKFTEVLKQTGIVLMVTVIFLVVMMCFDVLFGLLYDFFKGALADGGEAAASAVAALFMRGGGGLL